MVKSLKAQLDGILIFAGLFAGVNSAFLALTLPKLSADPTDDTNALLLQQVTGNGTIRSAKDLPSATFAPPPGIFPVNVIFSLSLTLALLSSFIAVLAQQWLVYYRKRSGGGTEHQRWEQLRRYLGAKRWRLEAILDDILPGLLQLALVIFCIGFVTYVRTLSKTMYYVIMGPMTIAVGVLVLMGIVGAWDRWCPFKSPLSHLLQGLGNQIKRLSIAARRLAHNVKRFFTHFSWNKIQWSLPSWKEVWDMVVHIVDRALDRSGENLAELEAVAAKRVLCTSEDFNALLYTAVNLHGMTSKESIQCFLGDKTVYKRLEELWEGGRRSAGFPELLAGAFSRAFLQLVFMGESAKLLVEPRHRQRYSEALLPRGQDPTSLHPLMQNVSFLDRCIDMGLESLHAHCDDSIWLLHYCQILKVAVDETYLGSGLVERWLNDIIAKYSISGDFRPHRVEPGVGNRSGARAAGAEAAGAGVGVEGARAGTRARAGGAGGAGEAGEAAVVAAESYAGTGAGAGVGGCADPGGGGNTDLAGVACAGDAGGDGVIFGAASGAAVGMVAAEADAGAGAGTTVGVGAAARADGGANAVADVAGVAGADATGAAGVAAGTAAGAAAGEADAGASAGAGAGTGVGAGRAGDAGVGDPVAAGAVCGGDGTAGVGAGVGAGVETAAAAATEDGASAAAGAGAAGENISAARGNKSAAGEIKSGGFSPSAATASESGQ
ncbi:hypothetical protein FRC05_004745 [Tulasnella sp. 425]|nr:hypothetical protein FRC05_004745 [Tulasnella sp. 425]